MEINSAICWKNVRNKSFMVAHFKTIFMLVKCMKRTSKRFLYFLHDLLKKLFSNMIHKVFLRLFHPLIIKIFLLHLNCLKSNEIKTQQSGNFLLREIFFIIFKKQPHDTCLWCRLKKKWKINLGKAGHAS